MRKWMIAVVVLLATGFVVPAAWAQTTILARSGVWEVFEGKTDQGGRDVCGIAAQVGERYFGLKLFGGNETFSIQLGGRGLPVEKGQKVDMTLRFDANALWRSAPIGFRFSDGDPGLETKIHRSELEKFFSEFRNSNELRLQFSNLNTVDWVLPLNGTNALGRTFQICSGRLP